MAPLRHRAHSLADAIIDGQDMALNWKTLSFRELDLEELYALLRLRQQVFVVEQDCAYLDLDNKDQVARHILAFNGDQLVAYQRCLPPGASYPAASSIGRIIVHPDHRGTQLGRELVAQGIRHNADSWPDTDICINAQAHLQGFYGSLGFVAEGEEYMEDGIPHRKMRLQYPAS
ncbi:MAG: GNAT family N-acetyltransferase [Halioglobus sp.]